jgi:antitoxin PrlF
MRVTIKGQVTIPLTIRQAAGIVPGTEVGFDLGEDGVVRLRRAGDAGAAAVAGLRGRARGDAGIGLTTDAIMALTRG